MTIFEMIALFVFVMSIIFCGRYLFEFILNMRSDEPVTLVVPPLNQLFLLGTISYIITYIIVLIAN